MSTPPSNLPFAPEVSDEELEAELVRMSSDAPSSASSAPPAARPASPPPVDIRAMPPVVAPPSAPVSPAADDMFSGLDQSPKKPVAPMGLGDLPQRRSSSVPKYILLFFVALIVVGGIGFVFWEFAIKRPAEKRASQAAAVVPSVQPTPSPVVPPVLPSPPVSDPVPVAADPTLPVGGSSDPAAVPAPLPTPVVTPPVGTNIPPPDSIAPPTQPTPSSTGAVDSDQDGLSDQRELELGTDPQNKDTDADGLTDGDEVLKYGTNPLDRDTDKDGFLDGKEVENGYNPRGSNRCAKPDCSV